MISKDSATTVANRVIPGRIISEIELAIWCLIVYGESGSMKNTLSDDGTKMHVIAELGDCFCG
jgi:hypothetical protein